MAVETDSARQRLIDSAIRLIHAGSYNAVSVNDLCAAAQVKKGSFYYFFPTKRDLALAAVDAQWERIRIGLFDPAFASDIPPLERIVRYFQLLTPWAKDLAAEGMVLGCPFGNLGVEMATQDPVIRAKIQEIFHSMADYFVGAVREACESGDCAELDPRAAAGRLVAYLEGLHLFAKLDNDPHIFVRLGDAALSLIDRTGDG